MPVTQSTFGATEQRISTFGEQQQSQENQNQEQQQQETQSQSSEIQNNAENSQQQEGQQEQQQESQNQEVDYSISSFTIGGEESQEQQQQEQQQQQPQFNLDEEIAKVDRKELLKKLGLNEFVLELNDHLTNGGSALDYLNAKSIDYTKVSDENIIKSDYQNKNPRLTSAQIDLLYKKRYMVDEDASDEDKELAQVQLTMDADAIRNQLINTQKQFKIPEAITPQKDEAYEQWKQYRDSQKQVSEQINGFYLNHAATKSLHENKKVAINVGEGFAPFNITIDKPEMITKSFMDGGETWQKLTSTQSGEPDVQKQQMIALFSFNPQKFVQDVFNYGLQQGKRTLVAEGQNAQRPQTKVLPMNTDQKPFVVNGVSKFGDKQR